MAEKRKAVDLLSIEDAKGVVEKRRQEVAPYVDPGGLPLEIQESIWAPVARDMRVLDLLDLAWVPSWGLQGLRNVLYQDDLWLFFWNRDFKATGYCKDIPLSIPGFLQHQDKERTLVSEDDQIFLMMPWRRYYLWTHYSLRTLTKIVVHTINEYNSITYGQGSNPLYKVAPRSVATLQIVGDEEGVFADTTVDTDIRDLIKVNLDSRLDVTQHEVWSNTEEWSLPVYIAHYLRTIGLLTLDTPAIFWNRDQGEKKYVVQWLVYCLRTTYVIGYARVIPPAMHHRAVVPQSVRSILMALARNFEQAASVDFGMIGFVPIVPRKTLVNIATGKERRVLFLGNSVCTGCGQEEATKRCARCKGVLYCSKDCQVAHWHSTHKNECK